MFDAAAFDQLADAILPNLQVWHHFKVSSLEVTYPMVILFPHIVFLTTTPDFRVEEAWPSFMNKLVLGCSVSNKSYGCSGP